MRRALTRFLDWHYSDKRELVGIEERFATVVELPDGEQVQLTGYADRLERDADGNIVVVDLKTGRNAPSNKSVETHRQLALYQYAVDSGALDASLGSGAELRSGGAELVQLGALEDGPAVGPAAAGHARGRARAGGAARGDRPDGTADPRGGVPGDPGRPPSAATARSCPSARPRVQGRCCPNESLARSARPEELQAVMRTEFAPSPQQWAAISAPLAPSVVIAGAGSGKTTLMAARVVYLVVTGQVRPTRCWG